ncbi:out at first protein isoform X2 [Strongylocentrotus purpuratus]|uniref:Out at first protein n=1 Tax=Strongylocentrotus purpuratus TaxID=7668 RepID=A0A7M7SVE7_STRPU|nr:out at first protein isoform X2 [Strongylocentrotus purpuratus]|eukprot:XP_793899.3 PREDICTED: out at first protein [Strongylocentrotus purpuratus]
MSPNCCSLTQSLRGLLVLFCILSHIVTSQLVINVKNDGGDLVQESINADVKRDVIYLQFQKLDGTLVKMVIDFKSEVRIFKTIVLGEEERLESQYHIMCFVTKFSKAEFISSDAMSKLRQKNPGTIRNPEEDKGRESMTFDMSINLERSARISPHIYNTCIEAKERVYTRTADIKAWSKGSNLTYTALMNAVQALPVSSNEKQCGGVPEVQLPCSCQLEVCIGWYPCGLKYCRGRDSAGNVVSYRCGIKTCKRCHSFNYHVDQKLHCLWDDTWKSSLPGADVD